jgi:RNA polymerase sigma-70 factor, ECF subfamily
MGTFCLFFGKYLGKAARTSKWRMPNLTDEREDVLLRRAAHGDEEAFTLLYRRHQAALYRYALRMTGSSWSAEEITQDVFMILAKEPKKFDAERGSLGAFLFGVARNRVMKQLERTPRELPLEHPSGNGVFVKEPADLETPAVRAEQRERIARVREAVLGLPTEFREALVLCELEELSYEEAARLSKCPIGTIRSRLHRGRALLLAKLELLRDIPKRTAADGARKLSHEL